jgi:hypothetical protein
MTAHKATPKQWEATEEYAHAAIGCYSDSCLLELRDRVAALEAAALEHARHLRLDCRIPPVSEAENDRRFRDCMAAIDNATPEQIRELTQRPAPGTLVQALARITGHQYDARRCIGQVALWLERYGAPAEWVHRLHDEADRELP